MAAMFKGVRVRCWILVLLAAATPWQSFASAWFVPESGKPKAVAMLIHGLNLKPSAMDQLARSLAVIDVEVLRVELSGHKNSAGADDPSFQKVTARIWLDEARSAYRECTERARARKVPIFFVGFSLGGLLGELLLNQGHEGAFERVVLFAPAISVRPLTYVMRPLFLLGDGFVLGSVNDPAYRANSGTPMAAYRATFELQEQLEATAFKRSNIPTLLLIDPDDEFVSFSGIERIIRKYSLTEWRILRLSTEKSKLEQSRHHLIVDESALGTAEWVRVKEAIQKHFMLMPRS